MDPTVLTILASLGLTPVAVTVLAFLALTIPVGVVEWLKSGAFGLPPLRPTDAPGASAIVDTLLFGLIAGIFSHDPVTTIVAALIGTAVGFSATGAYGLARAVAARTVVAPPSAPIIVPTPVEVTHAP